MDKILLVGVGGFLGAVFRFGFQYVIRLHVTHSFPVATLIINFLGSMLVGLLFQYFKHHHLLPTITLFFIVGFLGSFTTFSTFSFETMELFRKQETYLAGLNIVASISLCLGGVVLGEWVGAYFKI